MPADACAPEGAADRGSDWENLVEAFALTDNVLEQRAEVLVAEVFHIEIEMIPHGALGVSHEEVDDLLVAEVEQSPGSGIEYGYSYSAQRVD